MKSMTLYEAAAFLKLHSEELRRRAKRELLPVAKVGKRWVFLELDLAEYLRSLYAGHWQALRVIGCVSCGRARHKSVTTLERQKG